MTGIRRKSLSRRLKALWRDTWILLKEFSLPLALFVIIIATAGLLYHKLSITTQQPMTDPVEAIYHVLAMTFLQSNGEFPHIWYLQIFYFITPFIGIGLLALGLADFGSLFFNRKGRGKEWEMAVASTFSNHIVLVGLGHLGFRVTKQLHEMDQLVVVIELTPKKELTQHIRKLDIPVIEDDGALESTLLAAGINRAKTIVLCTQNDSLNLQIAVKARSINPSIEVIIRIFDDDFAASLSKQFNYRALSATGMAAPIFAASAAQADVTPPINIEGQPNSLARITVHLDSELIGLTIGQLETQFALSFVYYQHGEEKQFHPLDNVKLQSGDTVAVLGHPTQITKFVAKNH